MSTNDNRLMILRVMVKIMLLLALGAFLWVLFGSVPKRGPVEAVVTRFNIADMQPGDFQLLEWQKKPLFIVYRKPDWESALQSASAELYRDPGSQKSTQPVGANTALRSAATGWFVTLGLGTGAGCTLAFKEPQASGNEVDTNGYFSDGCDQSRFDLAGRVYKDQAAPRNTVIPEWRLEGNEILVSD